MLGESGAEGEKNETAWLFDGEVGIGVVCRLPVGASGGGRTTASSTGCSSLVEENGRRTTQDCGAGENGSALASDVLLEDEPADADA